MEKSVFFNRDLSWLGFNGRVLLEAAKDTVPVLERIKFLSIYSSNLDEFYRVRMPVLMAVDAGDTGNEEAGNYRLAREEINRQQQTFGEIISDQILSLLANQDVHWIYNKPIPELISAQVSELFFNEILAHVYAVRATGLNSFFAENNKLYQAVILKDVQGNERLELINIPSDVTARFYSVTDDAKQYIVFLEDIIKHNIHYLFPEDTVVNVFNVKITRDAALNTDYNNQDDVAVALEQQLENRDFGLATRFLCEPGIPLRHLYSMIYSLKLQGAAIVDGGKYHNLKDLASFPLNGSKVSYPKWSAASSVMIPENETLFDLIQKKDILLNVPYQRYDPVLRFFNEAATDAFVLEIYATLYRVAHNSRIVSALITAARNGKKVVVMVELKARFDEANNIKWAKQMKAAGVKVIYSNIDLKVHAKVALVKRRIDLREEYLGLFATGNLNETTARFYTDHILLTSHQSMLKELEALFGFLSKNKKVPSFEDLIDFKHLLVSQFNLQQRFIEFIQREIDHAKQGLPAGITIKLNNLEEKVLISKLYEASQAGVRVRLIVRGICCLVPGIKGISEGITVTRIVDRYLEHGRIFIFENAGSPDLLMGSADWMNRNIYSRIEVCFPVYDPVLKSTIMELINLQLGDKAQESIYLFLQKKINEVL